MAPSMAASVVPTGTAPIVPTYVAPQQTYEDDEDEVEDIMKPKAAPMQQMGAGPSMGLIFGVALVAITLSAAATFYALKGDKDSTAAPVTPASSPKPLEVTGANDSASAESAEPVGALTEDDMEEPAAHDSAVSAPGLY
ncbi:hypothetical protein V5799_013346 [Amblyomma americanum]|uniref:Uncharacterized protein n=1 Tax=Amblyomma americanum TaxID=6943 RepID=A0AAQ4E698_AMBAM